ncbi:hypothetical protein B0O99DRAFT_673353 [Bisporella sp. PMI_857]|nr:hypothetical protein B0O99DRAFT_673353 [Bisporella sp. PMI_857]
MISKLLFRAALSAVLLVSLSSAGTIDKTKEGSLTLYAGPGCKNTKDSRTETHLPDACIEIGEGFGLSFQADAICKNGTNAIIGGFAGKKCDPTKKPVKDPFTVWDQLYKDLCIPTDGIHSMIFWCDGLPGLDMTKPYSGPPSSGGQTWLIIGLGLGLGLLFLAVVGLFAAYTRNEHFRERVKGLFGRGDGHIQL